jgi:23S rRNA pseudouridine1911/1915/1917 synthase
MAESGHGVVGDRVYGKPPKDPLVRELATELGRQALHARLLRFVHPATGAVVDCSAPMPPDMRRLVEALRGA